MAIEQRDSPPWHRVDHGSITDSSLIMIGRYGQLWYQGHAATGSYHVAQGLETGTLEALIFTYPTSKTESHRLIPQTVAIGQHQQFLALEIAERHLSGLCFGVMARHRQPHRLVVELD